MIRSPFELFNIGLEGNEYPSDMCDAEFKSYFAGLLKKHVKFENDKCTITLSEKFILDRINEVVKIPCKFITHDDNLYSIVYEKSNSLDFIDEFFKDESKFSHFPNLKLYGNKEPPSCRFITTIDNAVKPYKARESDVGYDLTIIAVKKIINKKTTLYTTGICIDIDHGYYTEIVPRSSIIKSGYMLANSVGIIENSYRGELMIALTKIDDESPDITLPFKCCQLIIRQQHHAVFSQVDTLDDSLRDTGGFGSTNVTK